MTIVNGYATLQNYKDYQRITSTDGADDDFIDSAIEAASRHIDTQCGQRFYVSDTDETRLCNCPNTMRGVVLFDMPLQSVTSITNGDGRVITSANYYLLPPNDYPKYGVGLRDNSSVQWMPTSAGNSQEAISILGKWGNACPTDVYYACLELAKAFYSRRFGENMTMRTVITPSAVVQVPDGVPDFVAAVLISHQRRAFA